ncbi:MAG: DNA/RNA nuclease SfsA [Clostridiales bacterium]|nr:DNA/RNA nuclease SfsA [Clostridiales bacterium]
MRYENITHGVFVKRPNRFIAEVEVEGHLEVVHVKNTGRCSELLLPGCDVWLTAPESPSRKTKYDLVAVRKGNGLLVNIDSQAPNKAVKEWLATKDYSKVLPEYTYGASRIDFYMERDEGDRGLQRYLMEVKGCTLEEDGIGYFPDAPTERGVKHIRELIRAHREGYNAELAFVIQIDGVLEVRPNIKTHPEFGVAFDEAVNEGVRIIFLPCHVEPDSLVVKDSILLTI